MTKKESTSVIHGDFTPQQESVNTFIHALGILFGIVAIPMLIVMASQNKYTIGLSSVTIYGLCFLMTFTFSTLYHGLKKQKVKELFKLLDRISIYFFIAGTYTPFILYYMFDRTGILMLSAIWVLVILGIFFELFLAKRYFILSVFFYLLMGWMFIITGKHFFAAMPTEVIGLILTGVFLYSVGVVFFVWQKWKYHHAIWHTLVLAASICHYVAVLRTVS